MTRPLAFRRACALLTLLGAACTPSDTEIVHVYEPYQGPPVFPNRRPTIELPNGEVGFTSDNGSDTVTVLDLATGVVLGTAPVGRNPIDNDGPHHLAVDRANGFAYVAFAYPVPALLPGPHAQHGLSTRAGFVQKLALDDLRPVGEVRVDDNPGDIVMSEDGARLVVAHYDLQKAIQNAPDLEAMRATLAVIEVDAILPTGSADPLRIATCIAPHGVALSRPDGAVAYVACYGEDSVAFVDTTDPSAEVVLVPMGPNPSLGTPTYGPYSAVLSPSGTLLAVGNLESRNVRVLDVTARAVTSTAVAVMGTPYFTAWSSNEAILYVPTQSPDAIVAADAVTGAIVQSRLFDATSCVLPHEAVLSGDGATLYLVCEGDHQAPGAVLALDVSDLSTKWTTAVGVYPDRLAVVGAVP